ncbi:hypothetical protein [Paenibacillus xylanexedens]|uniref:hypothetical protein n=1 Tax=Paenibacillus xylanexedens TaxID=528191 RepID=UPI0028E18E7B|nr:hypothetical protein [Paenibacillus xylanexedens]
MEEEPKTKDWSYQKEYIFEGGASVSISIGFSNVKPTDVINAISGLDILTTQVREKIELLKEVRE